MEKTLSDLRLRVFRLPLPLDKNHEFEKLFYFWNEIWLQANAEMGRPGDYYSEQLSRQHEILALYKDLRPIALVCHRYVDLAAESTYWDSYIKSLWRPQDMQKLREYAGSAVLGSQITIDPNFRKSSGLGTKYLISFLSLSWAQAQGVDSIVGMMRVDKGMDRVFYDCGARPIAQGIVYHKTPIDFVIFRPKEEPVRIPTDYRPQVNELIESAELVERENKTKIGRVA